MYKIKIIDIKMAKQNGVKLESKSKIWIDLENGTYTDEVNATKFESPEKASEYVYPWEAIIRVTT